MYFCIISGLTILNTFMNSGVCTITNNHHLARGLPQIEAEGIFSIEKNTFQMEWTFALNQSVQEMIWVLSFSVRELIDGNDQDMLIFWADLSYQALCESRCCIPPLKRDIFYLKLSTWLNPEEERFLRDYNRMNQFSRQRAQRRYDELQERIHIHIVEERERIMHLLNNQKGHGWGVDLF